MRIWVNLHPNLSTAHALIDLQLAQFPLTSWCANVLTVSVQTSQGSTEPALVES